MKIGYRVKWLECTAGATLPCGSLGKDLDVSSRLGQLYNNATVGPLMAPEPAPTIEGTGGGATIYRTREGIERFMITDINNPAGSAQSQSSIPVMMDSLAGQVNFVAKHNLQRIQLFNHVPGGCNVLYMDGHAAFQKYPNGDFPCNAPAAWAHSSF